MKVNKVTHPFDLDKMSLEKLKKSTFVKPKGVLVQRDQGRLVGQTTIKQLILTLRKQLPENVLSNDQWEEFCNQFDKSDANADIVFTDFLQLLSRESFLRDTLCEQMLFLQSAMRFEFQRVLELETLQQIQALQRAKKYGSSKSANGKGQSRLPIMSYLLVDLLMFEYNGVVFLITTNEHGNVSLYDYKEEKFLHELTFKIPRKQDSKLKALDESSDGGKESKKKLLKKPTIVDSDKGSIYKPSDTQQLSTQSPIRDFAAPSFKQRPRNATVDVIHQRRFSIIDVKEMNEDDESKDANTRIAHEIVKEQSKFTILNQQKVKRFQKLATTDSVFVQPKAKKFIKLATTESAFDHTKLSISNTSPLPQRIQTASSQNYRLSTIRSKVSRQPSMLSSSSNTKLNSVNYTEQRPRSTHKKPAQRKQSSRLNKYEEGRSNQNGPSSQNNNTAESEKNKLMGEASKLLYSFMSKDKSGFIKSGNKMLSSLDKGLKQKLAAQSTQEMLTLYDDIKKAMLVRTYEEPGRREMIFRPSLNIKEETVRKFAKYIQDREDVRKRTVDSSLIGTDLSASLKSGFSQEPFSRTLDKTTRFKSQKQKSFYQSLRDRKEPKTAREMSEKQSDKVKEKQFERRLDLLYPRPNTLEEIVAGKPRPDPLKDILNGIRSDEQKIAKGLERDLLFNKVFTDVVNRTKTYDKKLRMMSPNGQLPIIETLDVVTFDKQQEGENQAKYKFQKVYPVTDLTLRQCMNGEKGTSIKEDTNQKAHKTKLSMKRFQAGNQNKQVPLAMAYYKKLGVIVHVLASQNVVLSKFKYTAQRKDFEQLNYFALDHMPTCLTLGTHKSSGKFFIFVGMQALLGSKAPIQEGTKINSQGEKCFISILQVDSDNCYKITELQRIQSQMGQIVELVYEKTYGLIMACLNGYIQVFDSNNFSSRATWHNEFSQTIEEKKNQDAKFKMEQLVRKQEMDNWVNEEQVKNQLIKYSSGGRSNSNINQALLSQQMSELTFNAGELLFDPKSKQSSIQNKRNPHLQQIAKKAQDKKKSEEEQIKVIINCICFVKALDAIAFGTFSGQIGVIESSTMYLIGLFDCFSNEITHMFYNKRELQLIVVSIVGEISLWDALKMEKLQVLYNSNYMRLKNISSAVFHASSKTLLLATQRLFKYQLHEDVQTSIQVDKQHCVATSYIKRLREALLRTNQIKKLDEESQPADDHSIKPNTDSNKMLVNMAQLENEIFQDNNFAKTKHQVMLKHQYEKRTNFKKTLMFANEEGSYNVLPNSKARLVGCFVNFDTLTAITIDNHCFIRQWDLLTNRCILAYPLEAPMKQKDFDRNENKNIDAYKTRHQICAVQIDAQFHKIAVAFQGGYIQVNNAHSGAVLFNKAAQNMINVTPQEVSSLMFFSGQNNFWLTAGCWEGKVAFVQRPTDLESVHGGSEVLQYKKEVSSHRQEVTCIDNTLQNQMVTASVDNRICFWNAFNGKQVKSVEVPSYIASLQQGQSIQAIKYPSKTSNEYLFVFTSNGDICIMETQSEQFLQSPDSNSESGQGDYRFGKLPKFSTIDVKNFQNSDLSCYILGIDGKNGTLYESHIDVCKDLDPASPLHPKNPRFNQQMIARRKGTTKTSKNFSLNLLKRHFSLGTCPGDDYFQEKNQIVKVEMIVAQGVFVVAKQNGIVGLYSLHDCVVIGYLNQPGMSPFKNHCSIEHKLKQMKTGFLNSSYLKTFEAKQNTESHLQEIEDFFSPDSSQIPRTCRNNDPRFMTLDPKIATRNSKQSRTINSTISATDPTNVTLVSDSNFVTGEKDEVRIQISASNSHIFSPTTSSKAQK